MTDPVEAAVTKLASYNRERRDLEVRAMLGSQVRVPLVGVDTEAVAVLDFRARLVTALREAQLWHPGVKMHP